MAAPPRDGILAVFEDNHEEIIFGFDGFPDCWADKVNEWNVVHYKDRKFTVTNSPTKSSKFELHCALCLRNGCEDSKLNKPSQMWFKEPDFASRQKDFFTHSSVNPKGHHPDCPCISNGPSISAQSSSSYPSSIQLFVEYSINIDSHSLFGTIRLATNDPNTDSNLQDRLLEKLDDMVVDGYIKPNSIEYTVNTSFFSIKFEIVKIPSKPSKSFRPSDLNIPGDPVIHLWFSNQYWSNLIFWRRKGNEDLVPIELIKVKKGDPSRLVISNSNEKPIFIIDKNHRLTNLTNSLQKLSLGTGNHPHPLGDVIYRSSEGEIRKLLVSNPNILAGIYVELHRPDIVNCTVMPLTNPTGKDTHLCIFQNPNEEEMKIRIRFFPLGKGLTTTESSSDVKSIPLISGLQNADDMILKVKDYPTIPPMGNITSLISLKGVGELRIDQVSQSRGTELIFAKEYEGTPSQQNSVKIGSNPDFSKLNIADKNTLIQTIISASNSFGSNFDDWKMWGV